MPTPVLRPQHVLVVDREPLRREQVAGALRAAGWHVVVVGSGREAVEGLAEPGFDLLVVDLNRPDLDLGALRAALAPALPAVPDSLEAAERRHIALVLAHVRGNKRQAAHLLGISRSTLQSKVRRYGLDSEK